MIAVLIQRGGPKRSESSTTITILQTFPQHFSVSFEKYILFIKFSNKQIFFRAHFNAKLKRDALPFFLGYSKTHLFFYFNVEC